MAGPYASSSREGLRGGRERRVEAGYNEQEREHEDIYAGLMGRSRDDDDDDDEEEEEIQLQGGGGARRISQQYRGYAQAATTAASEDHDDGQLDEGPSTSFTTFNSNSSTSTLPPVYRSRSHSLAPSDALDHSAAPAAAAAGRGDFNGQTVNREYPQHQPQSQQLHLRHPQQQHQQQQHFPSSAAGPAGASAAAATVPVMPDLRARDHATGYDAEEVRTRKESKESDTHSSKRKVDFAQVVLDELTRKRHSLPPGAAGQPGKGRDGQGKDDDEYKPKFARTMSDFDREDEETTFDDYDWDDDDELVKQLDERYESEQRKQRDEARRKQAVIRKFSPVHLGKLVFTTFLGNVILVLLLITPALVVQFLVKNPTSDDHLVFVCDNIQAWCYWIAFNFIARWVIHTAFEVIPRAVVAIVELVWGSSNEKFTGWVEVFIASKGYIKPLFFSGFFWGSFAIIFNSIFSLRDSSDPSSSRAAYTYRVYQVVELLFFVAIVYSVEKILIRVISLRFHAVAYAERLKDNAFALATIDRLKDYRPKKSKRAHHGYASGAQTPRSSVVNEYFAGAFSSAGHRSGANTPSAFRSPASTSNPASAAQSPTIPGAQDQHSSSLWSRLPIPSAFNGKSSTNSTQDKNTIPLQESPKRPANSNTANAHTPRARQDTADSHASSATPPTAPGTPSYPHVPGTPNGVVEALVRDPPAVTVDADGKKVLNNKTRRKKSFFRRKGVVTAQEIARQAMVDPLKTLSNPALVKNGLGLDFASPADGKRLARDLFYAFRSSTARDYLITSDFYPAFPSTKEAEAAFAVFDKDGNGDISRSEIKHTILAAYKERRYLARALQDASTAIGVLDRLLMVCCLFIVALIAFAVFGVNIYSNLTTAYTIAIAISFIFKSAAQNVFDSVIFLFATHPFDTGDRVVVEDDVFVVKQLGLFSTLFTRWDGTETLIANSKLGTLFITNYRRSPGQFENATLQVAWGTTLEQLDALEAKMNEWLQKDEKRMFKPSTSIVLKQFDMCQSITCLIGMAHRENWQGWGERWERRTAFHAALLYYTNQLGITYYNAAQPVQYWQEDLDAEPIYDDDDDIEDSRSPISPVDGNNQIPAPAQPLQPVMGFLPPEGSNMRRRKGFSKRRNMVGVGL